jgi:hypothetical protein
MLAKKTSKNQITLPQEAVRKFPGIDYFEVTVEDDQIKLSPVTITSSTTFLKKVRRKISDLGLKENEVAEAVQWARRNKQ